VYARSTTVRAQPDKIDLGITQVRDRVLPMVTAMPGCIGMSMMVDRESGECIVTTAWETEASMRASAEGVRPIREQTTELMSGTSAVQEWEIAVMHRDHWATDGSCVRSTWFSVDPSQVDHALDVYRMALMPRLEELEGFCSASLLVDRATGMSVSSIAFDTRAAMEATRPAGEAIRQAAVSQLNGKVLDIHEYELCLAHLHVPELV
jgi:quinol monooxygenase YgiN